MYQGGTLDVGITPWIRRGGGVYDASPAPKYFIGFARADLRYHSLGRGHLTDVELRGANGCAVDV